MHFLMAILCGWHSSWSVVTGFLGVSSEFAYVATIFLADIGLLITLLKLVPTKPNLVLGVYWLSPVVIFTSWCSGL